MSGGEVTVPLQGREEMPKGRGLSVRALQGVIILGEEGIKVGCRPGGRFPLKTRHKEG